MEHIEVKKYRSSFTDKVAEYDKVTGLFYIEGVNFTDGSQIPFQRSDFENSKWWEPVYDNTEQSGRKKV